MRRLRVRQAARDEIATAFDWYLERLPAAAGRFLESMDKAMRLIEEAPERHPIIRGACVACSCGGSPDYASISIK